MSCGVEFPKGPKGDRPTTSVNQGTFEAAVKPVDQEAAKAIAGTKGWRFGYVKHVVKQVQLACKSPETAFSIAEAGSQYLHDNMVFIRPEGGEELSVKEAMAKYTKPEYKTATIKGSGLKTPYHVPYSGKNLKGDALRIQIDKWVRAGVIEMSCGESLMQVLSRPDWWDLSDKCFVLFGAGSAMGPYPLLMEMGATVIALDLERQGIWDRLISIARGSAGTLVFPVSEDPAGKSDEQLAKIAGCNLLTKTPEIRTWLVDLFPEKQLVLGAYAYLDGPLFVKVSVAMDAVIKELVQKRALKPSLAYLCTPTDAHVVPAEAMTHSNSNYAKQPMWQSLVSMVFSLSKKFRMAKNASRPIIADNGDEFSVVDAIVPDQGPNYILAKRLQHWRAILARKEGCVVSTNIAPSTATKSVVSNKAFALAYKGMHYFTPVEVFQQETSNAVMTGLMISDLNNPLSAANPSTPLPNPMCLFSENSFHGGAWRTAYKFGSIGAPSALAFLFVKYIIGAYLFAYNAYQTYGWAKVLTLALPHLAPGTGGGLWAAVGKDLEFFQNLAMLEVAHAATGITRSGVMTTFLQLLSRVGLVYIVKMTSDSFATADSTMWLKTMIFAWSLTEVVRYAFYGLGIIGMSNILLFLRYTLFIVLYPMGVAGELGCIKQAQDAPNASKDLNFLTKIPYPVVLTVYALGLSFLYMHMLQQRKKALGKPKKADQSKDKKQ